MPHFKTINVPEGLVGVWQLTETVSDLISNFSPEELENTDFQKYTHDKRKVEWLATRILLKQLIGSDFAITYNSAGKPFINHRQYKFLSISHSRDFVAIYLHQKFEVGIDIENENRNYAPIIKRFLSADEMTVVGINTQLQCLYWCAKETIFKLVPDEGVEFREQILISPFNPELNTKFAAKYISGNSQTQYQLYFQIFANNCMVWATGNPSD
jgi:4'-phosphopantetheinyl transferase